MRIILCFIISIGAVFLWTPLFRQLADHFKIVDLPNKRKPHKKATPLLGGAAICCGVILAAFLKPYILGKGLPLLIGGICVLTINLIDDIRGLPARTRFLLETLVTLGVVFYGIRVTFLPPGILGEMGEILLTIIWFVGVANAYNYLDGLNGLATGSACINFFWFSSVLFLKNQDQLGFLALILLGSCLGFLPHNFKRARIFLGDSGSTFLGFMLAGIAILGNWAGDNVVRLCVPVLILGVPIFDMIFTTIIRVKEKKVTTIIEWLKYGGKDHFHHYLIYLGLSRVGSVLFIWTLTFALGLSSVMLSNDTAWEGLLTLFHACVIFAIIGVLIVVGRKRRSGWNLTPEDN